MVILGSEALYRPRLRSGCSLDPAHPTDALSSPRDRPTKDERICSLAVAFPLTSASPHVLAGRTAVRKDMNPPARLTVDQAPSCRQYFAIATSPVYGRRSNPFSSRRP